MGCIGFDNAKYLKLQSEHITQRIGQFGGKLYMEFGGKLYDDYHASRVLPGFEPDIKLKMLQTIAENVEIVVVINANDIEKNKQRGDLGISYGDDALRLIDMFRSRGLFVGSVVVTMYDGQQRADRFRARLSEMGMKSYVHYAIEGYPADVERIVSEEGYGRNEYVETQRSLIVVTAPGPGSGKMAVCLSQLYHDMKRSLRSGYAKFETFPIWNLDLQHPVNMAYEAATADLDDVNMIDHYHLAAYNEKAVNYNRDIEIFPVLNRIMDRILGQSPYKSPTDMGVNMVGYCICDDACVREASRREILRRFYQAQEDARKGEQNENVLRKLRLLLDRSETTTAIMPEVEASLRREEQTGGPAAAMQMDDGSVVTGRTSDLMGCAASLLLNALKRAAGIDQERDIISHSVLEPICRLKVDHLGNRNPRLHSDEVLMCLCISAVTDECAAKALAKLDALRGKDAHFTVILSQVDAQLFRRLGVNISSEPRYEAAEKMYHK